MAGLWRGGLWGSARPLTRLFGRGAAGRAEPPDPALEEMERVLERRRKAIWLRRLRREMEPPGPPQRSLSWEAMEQIRYLRETCPEEWPAARLAQGFHVSVGVIQRVLRSKFSPPLERRAKQDEKALGERGSRQQRAGLDRGTELLAVSAGEAGQLLPPTRPKDGAQSAAPVVPGGLSRSSVPRRLGTAREGPCRRDAPPVPRRERGARPVAGTQAGPVGSSGPGGDGEAWDGQVLSEEELAAEGRGPSAAVVRRGRDFLDSDGNFLYRIPAPGGEETGRCRRPCGEGSA